MYQGEEKDRRWQAQKETMDRRELLHFHGFITLLRGEWRTSIRLVLLRLPAPNYAMSDIL
jgi:hypothetical protein